MTGQVRAADPRLRREVPGGAIAAPARGGAPSYIAFGYYGRLRSVIASYYFRSNPALPGATASAQASYISGFPKLLLQTQDAMVRNNVAITAYGKLLPRGENRIGMQKNSNNERNGRSYETTSVSLPVEVKRALDARCRERGESRSEAVAEAVRQYLAAEADRDQDRITRLEALEAKLDRESKKLASLASNAEIAAGMTLAAMRHHFPSLESVGYEKLRAQAVNARRDVQKARDAQDGSR